MVRTEPAELAEIRPLPTSPGWVKAILAQPTLFDVSNSFLKSFIARHVTIIMNHHNHHNPRSISASRHLHISTSTHYHIIFTPSVLSVVT